MPNTVLEKVPFRPGRYLQTNTRSQLLSHGRATGINTIRLVHTDGRVRLSKVWVPTGGIAVTENEDAHSKLIRAGFLRQSYSGIYHMLPLGRRVQDKLEGVIDKHMGYLGASRLALSTISSAALWEKSGRLTKVSSELFQFSDRKEVPYLLSPTHEEEITTLVKQSVTSYKSLPLRLYQITRKYRDEARPRLGLLRSREFTMKDLYTFDYSTTEALKTYEEVRAAYGRIFAELKIPILVAEASSGDIGGDLSHEYHLPAAVGEDHVVSCDNCDYVINDEIAGTYLPKVAESSEGLRVWRGISRDRKILVNVWYPASTAGRTHSEADINVSAVKSAVPELDGGIEDALPLWRAILKSSADSTQPSPEGPHIRLVNLVDCRLPESLKQQLGTKSSELPIFPDGVDLDLTRTIPSLVPSSDPDDPSKPLNLLSIVDGDKCRKCEAGTLKVQRAVELGHTFHLGTRYSDPLNAHISVPVHLLPDALDTQADSAIATKAGETRTVPMQMGCHGIGVSRIIAAVAVHLADDVGLNWPRAIAPYEAAVISGPALSSEAAEVYDELASSSGLDLVLDDRKESLQWKLKDADLVGFPVLVIVGREWKTSRRCEVQCRRLGVKEQVPLGDLRGFVEGLLAKL